MYLTELYFLEDTPNQILHMLSTHLLSMKTFYTTIGQYLTLYSWPLHMKKYHIGITT